MKRRQELEAVLGGLGVLNPSQEILRHHMLIASRRWFFVLLDSTRSEKKMIPDRHLGQE